VTGFSTGRKAVNPLGQQGPSRPQGL
jgi:hypothetical protein